MRLRDEVGIVTGAAHGMGEAEARLFPAEGARMVAAGIAGVSADGKAQRLLHALARNLKVTCRLARTHPRPHKQDAPSDGHATPALSNRRKHQDRLAESAEFEPERSRLILRKASR